MKRYRVLSTPPETGAAGYRGWLVDHAAEVVLAGAFVGAEVIEADGALVADYAAEDARLDAYVAGAAPALRAEAERLFPDVKRSRELAPIATRVSPPFDWVTLGLTDLSGAPVPCPADGPFTLHYVAPWCPDCHATIAALAAGVHASSGRAALVGLFAPATEHAAFFDANAPGATAWFEPGARSEHDRVRSFHAVLRQLEGDGRKWGVPATRRLWIRAGRFVARWS